jgi:hypothetical protein
VAWLKASKDLADQCIDVALIEKSPFPGGRTAHLDRLAPAGESAANVVETLKSKGIRKLITVDPHTTYAVKVLYPQHTRESFEVSTYFDRLNLKGKNEGKQVTLHDPCFYGRYIELSDVPVKVLNNLGFESVTVRNSRKFTHCCGGPAESISPRLTDEVLIAVGKPGEEPSLDEIVRAARLANADDFLEALPNGYETILGTGGVQLSGGQAKRIHIARAILRDAPPTIPRGRSILDYQDQDSRVSRIISLNVFFSMTDLLRH